MTWLTRSAGFLPIRRTAGWLAAAFLALQGVVIAVLLVTDAVKKKGRARRTGFPRPGTFHSTVGDTRITTYTYGADLYRDMLTAIDGAQTRILLETFIWKGDEVGRQIRDAVNRAAARGVEVYVIYDHFGNLVVPRSFYSFHPAVRVFRFPAIDPSLLHSPRRAAGLTHRKLLVVDQGLGFVGGYNLGSLYATEWRDTHLRLEGTTAFELGHSFAQVWNSLAAKHPDLSPLNPTAWNPPIRAINNIPVNRVFPIRSVYLDAISRAQTYIHLTTAYFIPDQQVLKALIEASRRGVDVRVIVPEVSNHILTDWLSRGFYTTLLRENITILLYRNAMIHAKTASIDGQWSIVGTANIDRLSLGFNYEIDLEIQDEDFAADMERIFTVDSANCRIVDAGEWSRRHPAARIAETVLIPLRPYL